MKKQERWNYFKTPKSLANRGKFLGALLLIVLAIIPTFIYVSNIQSSNARRKY
jgi:hypothetical protein